MDDQKNCNRCKKFCWNGIHDPTYPLDFSAEELVAIHHAIVSWICSIKEYCDETTINQEEPYRHGDDAELNDLIFYFNQLENALPIIEGRITYLMDKRANEIAQK